MAITALDSNFETTVDVNNGQQTDTFTQIGDNEYDVSVSANASASPNPVTLVSVNEERNPPLTGGPKVWQDHSSSDGADEVRVVASHTGGTNDTIELNDSNDNTIVGFGNNIDTGWLDVSNYDSIHICADRDSSITATMTVYQRKTVSVSASTTVDSISQA